MNEATPTVSLIRTTKGKLPRLPFTDMKDAILGKKYDLSVAFVSPKEAQALNITHRQKDYVPNILSFPLDIQSGEIIICLSVVRKEAKNHDYTYDQFLAYLLIHGMLHLKGYDHGSTMDALEEKWKKHFGIHTKSK